MAWRLAKSLETFRGQVNVAYPNRSKVSDGTIGDTAHAVVFSDHNPNRAGVVTALDLTHDPAHGLDAHKLADRLIKYRHPELKYIISKRRIAGAFTSWKWTPYDGENPHDKHIHLSVGVGEDGQSRPPYDSTAKWNIEGADVNKFTPAQVNTLIAIGFNRQASAAEKKDLSAMSAEKALETVYNNNKVLREQAAAYGPLKAKYDALTKPSDLPPGVYQVK